MVPLPEIIASNARIPETLPSGLVAVFIGATSGIGELTLKRFAALARAPRVYFLGRSQEAGERILRECQALSGDLGGEFRFFRADLGELKVVDDVCREIRIKEEVVNLLFLTAGTPSYGTKTADGLPLPAAVILHARTRFIVNLLPLIQRAPSLRRIVTVAAGSHEGLMNPTDIPASNVTPFNVLKMRGHLTSAITLSLEALARREPGGLAQGVSFVHAYPGSVKTGIGRGARGLVWAVMRVKDALPESWVRIPHEESAERHLFLATSAMYPPRVGASSTNGDGGDDGGAAGVPLPPVSEGGEVRSPARGTTGELGSGVYSVNWNGESAGWGAKKVLLQLREEGLVEKVWEHVEGEFVRICGSASI